MTYPQQPKHIEIVDGEFLANSDRWLKALAEDIKTRMTRSASDIYHIGVNLLAAQELLPHGEFLLWIKAEFGMGKSSAYKFINVAKAFQGKFPQNGNLEIAASALYLLASPDTPDDARDEALQLAAIGESVSPQKAREIVEKHSSVAQETAALGESLGLPTHGEATLPESDWIDTLTHTSVADVDDRPGVWIGDVSTTGTKLQNHQLINASTSNEWYTPKPFIDAAREVMGQIDLDPASNAFANKIVQARRFFTADDDGLVHDWYGKVWLNPPYGKEEEEKKTNQSLWSNKLINEYLEGRVLEAMLLVNAATGNRWFRPLPSYPICLVNPRIRFYNEVVSRGQPTNSNAIVYFGENNQKFIDVFSQFGAVVGRLLTTQEKSEAIAPTKQVELVRLSS